jgi:hypothetical protein
VSVPTTLVGDLNKPLASDPRNRWRLFWHDQLGRAECPYIRRWIVDLGPLGSIRLHHWLTDDDGRALHDHPWGFLTLVLSGSYVDIHEPSWIQRHGYLHSERLYRGLLRREVMSRGALRWRPAYHTHTVHTTGAWTILWAQPKKRNFGFRVWDARINGVKWLKANKYFGRHGLPPCASPSQEERNATTT